MVEIRTVRQAEQQKQTAALKEQRVKLENEKLRELEQQRDQMTQRAEVELQKVMR